MGHPPSMIAPTSNYGTDVKWVDSGSRVQIRGITRQIGWVIGTSPEAESRTVIGGGKAFWDIRILPAHAPSNQDRGV